MKKIVLIMTLLLATLAISCSSDDPAQLKLSERAGDYLVSYGKTDKAADAMMVLSINADGTGSIVSTSFNNEINPATTVDGTFGDPNSNADSFTFKFNGSRLVGDSKITFTDDKTVKFIPAGSFFGNAGTEYTLTKQASKVTIPKPYAPENIAIIDMQKRAGSYLSENKISDDGKYVTITINASGVGTWTFEGSQGIPITLTTISGSAVSTSTQDTVLKFTYNGFPVEITFYDSNLNKATITGQNKPDGTKSEIIGMQEFKKQ